MFMFFHVYKHVYINVYIFYLKAKYTLYHMFYICVLHMATHTHNKHIYSNLIFYLQ